MRSILESTLSVLLITSLVSAYKVPIKRITHRRHYFSSRHIKRSTDSNLLFSDASIIAPISIGTPPQYLYVLLDTSSSDLALFSPAYISQYKPSSSASASTLGPAFNPSSSSTFKSSPDEFQNNYGNGPTASSFIAKSGSDTVAIQGFELTNQPLASIESGNVSYGPMASGILGLAFEAVSTGMRATPPIQQLFLSGALSSPVFSFALRRPSTQSELSSQSNITQPGGIFTLGHLDNDQYQGPIGWANLVSSNTDPVLPTKWLAPLDNITVNGALVDGSQGLVANFDTGSSASRASAATLASIFAKAKGALMSSEGDYYVPCGDDTPPAMNITVSMGGVSLAIEPLDMLYKTQPYTNNQESFCKSTLSTTSSKQYDLQIGDDMMRSLFVAFQYNPPQVGIAAQSAKIRDEAAAPSYVFASNQAMAIDSPTSPTAPTTVSHVSVQTVTNRATTFVPTITESGEAYTFEEGGQYVPTATVQDQTVAASSTPVPIGTAGSIASQGGVGDSSHSSSAAKFSPFTLLFMSFAISASLLLLLS